MNTFRIMDSIKTFAEGTEEGLDYYFKAWYKQFSFFAIGFTKNKEAAEDIVSDCFIKVWNKRERFTNESMLKSYIYVTIANACKRWLENKQRRDQAAKTYPTPI